MQENSVGRKSSVVLYVALIALLSLPWYALMLRAKDLSIGRGMVVHTLMWCPALAALLTCYWSGIAISSLGFSWPKMRYIGLGYGLPILYALLAYVPYWIAVRGSFDISQYAAASAASLKLHSLGASLGLNIFLLLGFGVISSISSGLGEEIGWRGFLFPSLFWVMGATSAVLFFGFILGFYVGKAP